MSRRGASLVELLVALAIGGVILASFARTQSVQRRAESRVAANSSRAAAADEVLRIVTASLSRVAADDSVWVRGDTAVEWRATIGVALSCAVGADSVVVPETGPAAWWEFAPDSSDGIELGSGQTWMLHQILGGRARSAGACGGPDRVLRIGATLDDSGPLAIRVTRRIRLVLYRGGDGAWWLGERRCPFDGAVRCSAAQPIAGPINPAPRGLRFRIDSSGGARTIEVTVASGAIVRRGAASFKR